MTSGSPVSPARLPTAIGLAVLAVPFAALAPLIGSVSPEMPPAYPSWLVLALVSALPPVLAVIFASRGDHGGAAGILRAAGMLAPGLLLVDLQVLVDPLSVARPDLFVPTQLVNLSAGGGLYLLLLSRLLMIVSAVLAGGEWGTEARDTARARPGLMYGVLAVTGLLAVPLFVPAFLSSDPYLPVRLITESPALVVAGTVLLAGSMLFAGAYFVGAADPEVARGGLIGLVAAAAGVTLVPAVSALATPGLGLGLFQWVGLVQTALVLVVLGILAWVAGMRRNLVFEIGELPGHRKLQPAAGVLATVAGVLAVVASALPIARLASGEVQSVGSARMLAVAGFILLGLGLLLLAKDTATSSRPALAVAWVLVPATGLDVLDTAFSQVNGLRAALLAAALVVLAAVCASVAGLLCVIAGGQEREDTVDLSEISADRVVLVPALLGAALGFGAYLLPVVDNPEFPAAGLLWDFRTETWGLLLSLTAVVGAALLAPRSRPARASALLAGAALVVALRVAELPVRGGGSAGLGFFLGLAALAALLAGAGVAWSRRSSAMSFTE
ncbi:hypothetical protein M8C13_12365 [Crossiella sp. SN42]|uniref:hypothetical protein n=1 Tax=Crossiella sp. SN42 TaxID=2944808 RepID=UPI00207CB758|nr:hypothetical protein [Crossiella sp. SN42]MCO1576545.1 hypothetical protein [Crossiella sp. SN42]